MANNYNIISGNGANVTFVALDTGAGILLDQKLLSSADGLPITNTNSLPVKLVYGLPTGANVIGGITQSGTWNLTINTGLPAGVNVIGIVNVGGLAASNAVPSGNPVPMAGLYLGTQPTINANCIGTFAITTKAAQIVATGADVFVVNCCGMAGQNSVPNGFPVLMAGVYNAALPTINSTCVAGLQLDTNGRLLTNTNISVDIPPTEAIAVNVLQTITNNTTNSLYTDLSGRLYVNTGAFGTPLYSLSNTPTINTSAYTNGYLLGGLMTFPSVVTTNGLGLLLKSISITSKTVQTCGIKFYFFNKNPTNSTWTDHASPAINATDIPFLWGEYTLGPADSGLGTHTVWNLDGIEATCNVATTNVYAVMVVNGTPTFTSTSDLVVSIGFRTN